MEGDTEMRIDALTLFNLIVQIHGDHAAREVLQHYNEDWTITTFVKMVETKYPEYYTSCLAYMRLTGGSDGIW
jgi:hypothetical protein